MSSVTTLTEKDVFDFLINAYFGCIDEPIGHAANSAYLDLNRTIEFKGSNSVTDVLKAKLRQKVVVAMKSKIDSLLRKSDINQALLITGIKTYARVLSIPIRRMVFRSIMGRLKNGLI